MCGTCGCKSAETGRSKDEAYDESGGRCEICETKHSLVDYNMNMNMGEMPPHWIIICSDCEHKANYGAETKLSKTSCCCGADEANPCACMKAPEPMECSAKAPKCACYKALEKNAETYEDSWEKGVIRLAIGGGCFSDEYAEWVERQIDGPNATLNNPRYKKIIDKRWGLSAETYEAQGKPTWAGYCPFCKKWRTNEWSKQDGKDRLCGKRVPDYHTDAGEWAYFYREKFAREGGNWAEPNENICGVVLDKKQSKNAETFEAAVIRQGKAPKGAMAKAMMNKAMMEQANIEAVIQELENKVNLGLISEKDLMASLKKKFGAEYDIEVYSSEEMLGSVEVDSNVYYNDNKRYITVSFTDKTGDYEWEGHFYYHNLHHINSNKGLISYDPKTRMAVYDYNGIHWKGQVNFAGKGRHIFSSEEDLEAYFADLKRDNPKLAKIIESKVKNEEYLPKKLIESSGYDYEILEAWNDSIIDDDKYALFDPCPACEGEGWIMTSYTPATRSDPADGDGEDCGECGGNGLIDPADYMYYDDKGEIEYAAENEDLGLYEWEKGIEYNVAPTEMIKKRLKEAGFKESGKKRLSKDMVVQYYEPFILQSGTSNGYQMVLNINEEYSGYSRLVIYENEDSGMAFDDTILYEKGLLKGEDEVDDRSGFRGEGDYYQVMWGGLHEEWKKSQKESHNCSDNADLEIYEDDFIVMECNICGKTATYRQETSFYGPRNAE